MSDVNIKGMIPAAILPMDADYQPDYGAYEDYLEWLIDNNAVAIAVNMDTGEGPQLSVEERAQTARKAVEVVGERASVVAGVMGSTTAGAVEMTKRYVDAGVDALIVFPNAAFRNEPLDPRIPVEYHRSIAEASGLPLLLFQLAPVFGGVNFSREILLELLAIPEVIGIKEASFDAEYFAYTVETVRMAQRPITILTGNDRFICESFLLGAEGALLGFGAIGCGLIAEMLSKIHNGDYEGAVAMHPLVQGFGNSIYKDPVLDYRARCKVALAHIGVISQDVTYVRPPLLQISEDESKQIREALVRAGML